MGGFPSNISTMQTGETEEWNGSSWTEVNNMSLGRYIGGSSPGAPTSGAWVAGGWRPGSMEATEEFTKGTGVESIGEA